MASSTNKFKTREDWKKQKELEEARKAGTAPAERDEEGREINPHIPQYISQAPWYYGANQATLKHQRTLKKQETFAAPSEWYQRGASAGPAARTYRKGACENCGAMTHKAKDCFERPRAKGARFTNKDIRPDDVIRDEFNLNYDGAHDRWNGYDTSEHIKIVEEFTRIEEERKKRRAREVIGSESAKSTAASAAAAAAPSSSTTATTSPAATAASAAITRAAAVAAVAAGGDDSDDDSDLERGEDELADVREKGDEDMQGNKVDGRTRTTIRNLRIREDTAKYLRNLDPDSAFYDPKTRSMRENPLPHLDPNEALFSGDNFVRRTGEAVRFQELQSFAWEAHDKGQDVHVLAAPSQAEKLYEDFQRRRDNLQHQRRATIIEQYGGEEHLKPKVPRELLLGQTERFVQYAPDGSLLNADKSTTRSKWEEDVLVGNHTAVWGSFWREGQWGYACCHQFVKNAYCTGEAGRAASESQYAAIQERQQRRLARDEATAADAAKKQDDAEAKAEEEEEKNRKLAAAIKAEELRQRTPVELDERKRKYNSLAADTYEVSEQEVEAYRIKRVRRDDPMREYLENPDRE